MVAAIAAPFCYGVEDGSAGGEDCGEGEGRDAGHFLVAGGVHGEADEDDRADTGRDGSGGSSGDAEGAMQIRFTDPQDGESDELEEKGCSVEDEVDGDEPFERHLHG